MEDSDVFSIISKCFAPIEESEWEKITAQAAWSEFLNGARRALQDEKTFGYQVSTMKLLERRCPLQEYLTADEVNALFVPPTYKEKQSFARCHFTGGLPESVMPVESLYVAWSQDNSQHSLFPKKEGLYQGDSARYMRDVVKRLGFELPDYFVPYPDHLALELDLIAVLLRSGMREEARSFMFERLKWLTIVRKNFLQIQDDANFYLGLIDVLIGIRAQQGFEKDFV